MNKWVTPGLLAAILCILVAILWEAIEIRRWTEEAAFEAAQVSSKLDPK